MEEAANTRRAWSFRPHAVASMQAPKAIDNKLLVTRQPSRVLLLLVGITGNSTLL